MTTPSQLHSYCMQQLHMIDPTPITKGTHMLSWTLIGDLILIVIASIAAYEIGKRGLTAVYTWVRNKLSSAPKITLPAVSA
jgi:hypothetical protein